MFHVGEYARQPVTTYSIFLTVSFKYHRHILEYFKQNTQMTEDRFIG